MATETIKPGQAFLDDELANPTPDFDRLDAQGQFSAAEIRDKVGELAVPKVAEVTLVEPATPANHVEQPFSLYNFATQPGNAEKFRAALESIPPKK